MGGWGGVECGGFYDQLCCPASPKLLLRLALGLGCDNIIVEATNGCKSTTPIIKGSLKKNAIIVTLSLSHFTPTLPKEIGR